MLDRSIGWNLIGWNVDPNLNATVVDVSYGKSNKVVVGF